ncbi:MAG: hypothetical protein KDE14_03745 [Rhodobacteraceae bacterium]|nr:hypothetical protein [Paracoccaceae bacterium]
MNIWILAVACLILPLGSRSTWAEIALSDAFGRDIVLTNPARRIAPAGPPAEVLIYTIAPDLLAGWAREQPEITQRWLTDDARKLPVLGHLTGWEGEPAYRRWIDAGVDLFVDYGSVGGRFEALADTTQHATGIPYAVFDGDLEEIPATFRALGKLTDRRDRAEKLARAAEKVLADARAHSLILGNRPSGAPTVLVPQSNDWHSAIGARSQHSEIYHFAGARNVATHANNITETEIAQWNPRTVILLDPAFRTDGATDPFRNIAASKLSRIFVAPAGPWSWLGGPPSVNRLLGLIWLSQVLSDAPDWQAAKSDSAQLFALMYGRALSDAEIAAVFAGSR